MTSRNPYIEEPDIRPPTRPYTVSFVDEQGRRHDVRVEPDRIPYGDHGLPGSLLDIALGHGIEIDHACGGVCACSTCHVIVRQGLDSCNPAGEAEEDMLDAAYGVTHQSRLACRCVPDGTRNVVVEIPGWNRNLAREGHGS